MSNSHSDRNLLLGVLALQFGLVTREQLILLPDVIRGVVVHDGLPLEQPAA